jgi:hypothetical protein
MNQPLIMACLSTLVVVFAAFIIILERILDRKWII